MKKLCDNIKKLRISHNLSQPELAEILGISMSMLGMIEQGRRNASDDVKLKLCNYFNVSMDYLMGLTTYNFPVKEIETKLKKLCLSSYEYDRLIDNWVNKQTIDINHLDNANKVILNVYLDYLSNKHTDYEKSVELTKDEINEVDKTFLEMLNQLNKEHIIYTDNNVFPIPDEVVKLPVIGKISAGLPILAVENIIDYAFAPSSYIQKGYNYFYLKVQGDSMNRKFNDGDIILVQQQNYIENDEIGVFLINDEATVKKYYKEDNIIELRPLSTNPIHKKQEYNLEKVDFKIIGKVISYQGKI